MEGNERARTKVIPKCSGRTTIRHAADELIREKCKEKEDETPVGAWVRRCLRSGKQKIGRCRYGFSRYGNDGTRKLTFAKCMMGAALAIFFLPTEWHCVATCLSVVCAAAYASYGPIKESAVDVQTDSDGDEVRVDRRVRVRMPRTSKAKRRSMCST